jgi:hydroxyacylglutathione hydrolase
MDVSIIPILDDNYAYIIRSGSQVGVIDPGEAKPVIDYLQSNDLQLHWVMNTHRHGDHINGNKELLDMYDARLAAPTECGESDFVLEDGELFPFGDVAFQIFLTKGHTAGHIVLYDPTYRILFAGDTLFAMGCGRVFEGTMGDMFQSMQIIKQFPPETAIYCGHEYTKSNAIFARHILPDNEQIKSRLETIQNMDCTMPTLFAEELVTNPYLLAKNLDEFMAFRTAKDNF